MQITSIEVNNFKSLRRFRLDVPKFCCLVGLNGAGKSTVLQCVDFLSQLVRGDLDGWFRQRRWKAREILSSAQDSRTITFDVRLTDDSGRRKYAWSGTYDPALVNCTSEVIRTEEAELRVEAGQYSTVKYDKVNADGTMSGIEIRREIDFTYQGSILSQLRKNALPPYASQVKQFLAGSQALDLLAPEHLRRRAKLANGSIGRGGRSLSAHIHGLSANDRSALTAELRRAYPQLEEIISKALPAGWKELSIVEGRGQGWMTTDSRHVNDGMLRLMAILSELRSDHGLLLFDEIENGINPELVRFVVSSLVGAPQQIIATTHSPLILNYLEDEAARESVVLLYKTPAGDTQAVRLFDIPSMSEKLNVMGPGEAFVDTDLVALSAEASQAKAEA